VRDRPAVAHTPTVFRRIAVGDDDAAIPRLVCDGPNLTGYTVSSAESRWHALDVTERQELTHLIIGDINMPGTDSDHQRAVVDDQAVSFAPTEA
jgi:CheY-like chemotaxis protein